MTKNNTYIIKHSNKNYIPKNNKSCKRESFSIKNLKKKKNKYNMIFDFYVEITYLTELAKYCYDFIINRNLEKSLEFIY